jgi:hypothetical protein
MPPLLYRYTLSARIPEEEAEASLLLAVLAAEALHGESQVRLDAAHHYDAGRRACVIDAATAVGRDINRLFVGFLRREFGPDSFTVARVDATPTDSGRRAKTAAAASAT